MDVPIEKCPLGAGQGGRVLPVKVLAREGGTLLLMPGTGPISSLEVSERGTPQQS